MALGYRLAAPAIPSFPLRTPIYRWRFAHHSPAVDYTATLNHAEPIRPANTHRAPEPALSM